MAVQVGISCRLPQLVCSFLFNRLVSKPGGEGSIQRLKSCRNKGQAGQLGKSELFAW